MKHPLFIVLALMSLPLACKHEEATDKISDTKMMSSKDLSEVGVMILERKAFQKEIISNGKLRALEKSTLAFGVGEEIVKMNYRNGDFVEKGTVIASLDKEALQSRLTQVRLQFDKAVLNLKDILIGQGYELSDSADIPGELFQTAKLLSGYSAAGNELNTTMQQLRKSDLRAPFSGLLSGIEHNLHDRIGATEEYCKLINTSAFLVSFDVLESEISDIQIGKEVEVSPFSVDHYIYAGNIFEINPVVDEHGLIRIKALIASDDKLMEGMNMKVRIRTHIPDKLSVPKSAVLIRQNKDVLFKYSSGKAIWTYVEKELENSSSYAVSLQPNSIGSLDAGDTVIIKGNLNLAHESEVQIVK